MAHDSSDHTKQRARIFAMKLLLDSKVANKGLHVALQNVMFVGAFGEVSTGLANGKVKMKAEERHEALFAALGRHAELFFKVSHVSSFMSIP